jgi:hypothetical protein
MGPHSEATAPGGGQGIGARSVWVCADKCGGYKVHRGICSRDEYNEPHAARTLRGQPNRLRP